MLASALTVCNGKNTMTKYPSIREKVSEILTYLFGDIDNGIVFLPENTINRTVGGKKLTKYELKTSTSWSAEFNGPQLIMVSCVGMSMTEFIKEYNNTNIHYTSSNENGFQYISIFKNTPELKTYGCVRNLDIKNNLISLYFAGLIHAEEITTNISPKTPKWLIDVPDNGYACFNCKIYQSWRSLESFEKFNWDKIWKTFKFQSYLTKKESIEYF